MVALEVIKATSSRSPVLMNEYRGLHELCAEMDVELRVEHVSSALNEWADRLSREIDSTAWTLPDATWETLEQEYGPHTVDLFASDVTARYPRFYSRRPTPNAIGVNALQHDWVRENGWANPSFHLVGPIVAKIVASGATVTLVAPAWRDQPWWRRATEAATEWRLLPPSAGVVTHGSESTRTPHPSWRTAVFRFGGTRL